MIHPHDTDRILAVLGEAISKLRSGDDDHYDYLVWADEIANDLALLHGAVEAEAKQAETRDPMRYERELRHGLRYPNVHAEEIANEVMRGDHREDDGWRVDGDED